jgi:hypothetical protein
MNFVLTFSHFLFVFLFFAVVGLPFTALMPLRWQKHALLIAPSLGMAFLVSLYLLVVEGFLLPFPPSSFAWLLAALALGAAWKLKIPVPRPTKFFLIPLLLALLASSLFARRGVFMLSGGEDEILYAQMAEHLIHYQNTDHALDSLNPRMDHLIRDDLVASLAYTLKYRRGGEFLLAFVAQLLQVNSFAAFPILCFFSVMNLLLGAAFVALTTWSLAPWATILLQIFLASSYHLLLLQIQGSLANLSSLVFFFLSLTLIPGLLFGSRKETWLAALLLAPTLIFYSEVALIGAVAPLGLAYLLTLLQQKRFPTGKDLSKLALFLGALLLFANHSVLTFLNNIFVNLDVARQSIKSQPFLDPSFYNPTLAAIYGFVSLFSLSNISLVIMEVFREHSALLISLVGLFMCLAVASALRIRNFALAAALIIFLSLSVFLNYKGELLRFLRVHQYAHLGTLLLLYVGIFAFARRQILSYALATLCALLWLANLLSISADVDALQKRHFANDPVIKRLNPEHVFWKRVRETLDHHGAPVMLESFPQTPLPHAISAMLEPLGSFLGSHVRSYWTFLPEKDFPSRASQSSQYRQQEEDYLRDKDWKYPDWEVVYRDLEERAYYAATPFGAQNPWQNASSLEHRFDFGIVFHAYPKPVEDFLSVHKTRAEWQLTLKPLPEGFRRVLEVESSLSCSEKVLATYECEALGQGSLLRQELAASALKLSLPARGLQKIRQVAIFGI